MKYELRTKAWFVSDDGRIVQGLITKRSMLEIDDHDDGIDSVKSYFLRTEWCGKVWVKESELFSSIEELVHTLCVKCNFE